MNFRDDTNVPLTESLISAIKVVVPTFEVRAAPVADNSGIRFASGPLIVHSAPAIGLAEVPIDTVAAVIECHETLTIEGLRQSYARIEALKLADKRTTGATPEAAVDMTVGFIVARDSALSIEQIAKEVARLNSETPSQQWPDAVALLTSGLVNYTAHIPGRDEGGDFFLHAKGLLDSKTPPASMYVYLMVRGMGPLTFSKVISLLIVRIALFEPGINVHDYRLLLEGVPRHGLPAETYQLNLASRFVAMSASQGASLRLNFEIFNIESSGKQLGSIQFVEWQDGGVLVVRGNFPILPFFICLMQVSPGIPFEHLQYFGKPGGLSVSYVLPINRVHFYKILNAFERQSANIRVKRHAPKLLIQQTGDEGVASPFVSRLMVGVMEVRDAVHTSEDERLRFDSLYEPILSGARDSREACREIEKLWLAHKCGIESGAIVTSDGAHIRISESIDRPLKRELDSFLTTAVRTAKNAIQNFTHSYGLDIGLLFKKEDAFRTGIARIATVDATLAAYLEGVRTWTEPLVAARNDLEHGTVHPPKVVYQIQQSPVAVNEPMFSGVPITTFTNDALQRLLCFAEEIVIHSLSRKMPYGLRISEIPPRDRASDFPRRFRLSVSSGGDAAWRLSAGDARFDRT